MKKYIEDMFDEAIKAHKEFALDHAGIIEDIAKTIVECFENGNKVLIFSMVVQQQMLSILQQSLQAVL